MSVNGDLTRRGITPTFSKVQLSVPLFIKQVEPATMIDGATIDVDDLLTGMILGTPTAAAEYKLPLAADLDEAWLDEVEVDRAFDLQIVNLAATEDWYITITTNTGWTIVGNAIVNSNDWEDSYYLGTGTFRIRKTAADTFTIYRIA